MARGNIGLYETCGSRFGPVEGRIAGLRGNVFEIGHAELLVDPVRARRGLWMLERPES